MGFNPFKIIGKGVKAVAGVARTVAPIAAGLIPGGATALGTVNAIANQIPGGGSQPSASRTAGGTRFTGQPISARSRRLPANLESGVQFVSTTSGPPANASTQTTQPSVGVLDKIRMDLENALRGVAGSFGRDVARGVTQGAEQEGGLPLNVRGNLPIILGVGGLGIAAVVLAVVLTRNN